MSFRLVRRSDGRAVLHLPYLAPLYDPSMSGLMLTFQANPQHLRAALGHEDALKVGEKVGDRVGENFGENFGGNFGEKVGRKGRKKASLQTRRKFSRS